MIACTIRNPSIIKHQAPRLWQRGSRRAVWCNAIFQGLTSLLQKRQQSLSGQQSIGFGDASPQSQAWYESEGLQPGPLELKGCGNQGRGLLARARIRKGQNIMQVPEGMVITPEVALTRSSLRPLLLQQPPLPPWSLLALFLSELLYWGAHTSQHQHQLSSGSNQLSKDSSSCSDKPVQSDGDSNGNGSGDQQQTNNNSTSDRQAGTNNKNISPPCTPSAGMAKWLPYLEALPADPGTVLSWAEHVQALLQGSPLLPKALSITQGVAASCDQLRPIVSHAEQEGLIPVGALGRERLTWAFGILLSRLVRLTSKGNTEALVPWADFLNHSAQVDAHLDWEAPAGASGQAQGAVVLQADMDYQAGEQVYISYGQRASGQLLLSYGFCPSPSTHPHEAYLLQLGLKQSDPLHDMKAHALSQRGLDADLLEWPLRVEGLPAGIVAWAAFRAAGTANSSEAEIQALASSLFGEPSGQAPSPSSLARPLPNDELELFGMQELGSVCGALLKGYPTSMEQDRATAQKISQAQQPWTRLQELQQCTAAIRVVERQILARTQYIASSRVSALRKATRRRRECAH